MPCGAINESLIPCGFNQAASMRLPRRKRVTTAQTKRFISPNETKRFAARDASP